MTRAAIADVSTAAGANRPLEAPSAVLVLTIVSHPLVHRAGERCLLDAVTRGGEAKLSRNEPEFVAPGRTTGLPLGDPFVSRTPIRIALASPGQLRVWGEAAGTLAVAGIAIDHGIELSIDRVVHGVPIELADRVVLLLHMIDLGDVDVQDGFGMLGASAGVRRVRSAIARVVDLAVPVLIRGETGTGKELVARAIHDRGPHRDGPFVSVNLGAIPRELAAAELFGATRGAFTGANHNRDGLFRAAHGGTLFLDELGEAPLEVQAMLLRVLETGEMYPVGADRPVATKVRLLAATDANLEDQIRIGRFKAPLLHRLAAYQVRIPPLRDRRDDIGVLFHHFARIELDALGEAARLSPVDPYTKPWLPASIASQLVRSTWPGNIRQLRNLTRQLVIGSRGLPQARLDPQLAEELAGELDATPVQASAVVASASGSGATRQRRKPSEVTESELLEALQSCTWDLKAAADRLRIPRPSIYTLISRSPTLRTAGDLTSDEITACFRTCDGDLDKMVARLCVSKRALSRRVKELGLGVR